MLTIGIVVHSQPDYSEYCIRSVLNSSLFKKGTATLVVVANECDLETATRLKQLNQESDFLLLLNQVDKGYAAACNLILKQACSPYVAFLHNDVIVTERTFEHLVNSLEKTNEEVFLTFPTTNYANEHFPCLPELRSKFEEIKPSNKELLTKEKLQEVLAYVYEDLEDFALNLEQENQAEELEIVEEISSYCQVYRTGILKILGGFSEEYPARGYEDKDLYLRSTESHYSVILCHKAFVHHHGNLTTDGIGCSHPEIMERNREVYKKAFEKHKALIKNVLRKRVTLVTSLGTFRKHLRSLDSKQTKRLLYFGSHYPPENAGGAELSFHNTAKQLLNYGVEIAAFTIRNRYHKKFSIHRSFNHEGIHVLQVPEETGEELKQKLRLFIEQFQPDVVYAHSVWAAYVFSLITEEFPQIKRIFAFRHQTDITDGGLKPLLKKDGGVVIVSNSKWMQKVLREQCGRDSELVYPAVYPEQCIVPEELRDPKAVVIGNGVVSKGIKDLLAVARVLPDVPFQVFGTLDRSIPVEMVPHNVIAKGWVTDLAEIYKEAKLVINMSVDPEPFGRTLVEAMYNRIPTIAYKEGGPREIIREGGFLVDSPNDFVSTIEQLYADENLYLKKAELTQKDLELYNPYTENHKLVRILLKSLGHGFLEGFSF